MYKKAFITYILILALLSSGCGVSPLRQNTLRNVASEDIVDVRIEVLLERGFVQAASTLGAGAATMFFLLGPFSNNRINLYGNIQIKRDDGRYTSVGTFSNGLQWGENIFNIQAPKNSEIKLTLRSGGTRSGMADIGYAYIRTEKFQTVIIRLTEAGVEIE